MTLDVTARLFSANIHELTLCPFELQISCVFWTMNSVNEVFKFATPTVMRQKPPLVSSKYWAMLKLVGLPTNVTGKSYP